MDDSWVCDFCGKRTWKLRQGGLKYEHSLAIMAWHAIQAHQIDMGLLDRAQGNRRTWVLPDGRVWLRRGWLNAHVGIAITLLTEIA